MKKRKNSERLQSSDGSKFAPMNLNYLEEDVQNFSSL